MGFTITTNREVAEQIIKQCNWDERFNKRSYKLGKVYHCSGYSDVEILAKDGKILPSDLFWLGHFSASQ
jgi:hypothetical protein